MASIMNLYFSTFEKYALIYGKEKLLHACQVGSFMEFYSTETEGPDLQKLSEVLNIVVSRKDKSISKIDRNNPYMMGYPLVSHQKFLKIMLDNGYIVVVTEQTTPPPFPKRKVTGIFTPGTNIDEYSNQNNYLMGIYIEKICEKFAIGISLIDVSTGEVYIYETYTLDNYDDYYPLDEIVTCYKNYNPREVILCHNNINNEEMDKLLDYFECKKVLYYCKNLNEVGSSIDKIKYQLELFHTIYNDLDKSTLFENLDLEKMLYARIAFCFTINYIYNHNKIVLSKLSIPKQLKMDDTMYLGNNALQQLNVFSQGGLYKIINQTKTNMGSRYLKKQLNEPTFNKNILQKRYDLIDEVTKDVKKLEEKLNFNDIEKLYRKIELNLIHPMEFYTWYDNIKKGIDLLEYLSIESELKSKLKIIVNDIETTFQIEELKKYILSDIYNGIFQTELYPELEHLLTNINTCTDFMDDLAKFIINILPKGQNSIKVNKNDREGHYISLTTKRAELLQSLLTKHKYIELGGNIKIASSSLEFKIIGKGATTKIFAPELRTNSNKLNDFVEQIKVLNKKYFIQFLNTYIVPKTKLVHQLIDIISYWDFIYSGAKCVEKYKYSKPTIVECDKSFIQVQDMRHPIIEHISSQIFIPMSITLGKDDQDCILLYGLNSAGKSTLQKALGLNIIMAQIGYFVPCNIFQFNPYQALLTRINSNDNIFKGQSSFTLELTEIKAILKRSSQNTLVIADEVCKGTEHDSSLIVVMSIIEMLAKNKTSLITASHLHELSESDRLKRLKNVKLYHIHIDFDENTNTIIYNRELREGSGENFYGLNIAKYLMNDAEFNSIINDIKSEFTKDCIIGNKWSKYNAKLNINKCAICNYFPKNEKEKSLEVHHINFQKNADEYGFIKDKSFHKNHISNLVVLCSKCHDKIDTNKLQITGYKETSKGKKLEWHINE